MACLLIAPRGQAKGVISITTPERDSLVLKDAAIRGLLEQVKARFAVGLHHNWHDHSFVYNALFDFSFAGDGDLREINKRHVPRIDMDACNFAPSCFRPAHGSKFWDVLHVSRAVPFKNVPLLFRTIRRLYDQGHRLRVLYICPVPPDGAGGARREYNEMFTDAEQGLFNFLTMDYRYPFPLDLETLAFFYGSSSIFVHCSDTERRCRVAGYAWAAGLPVVAQACAGSLLPHDMRRQPYFFEASDEATFSAQILRALAVTRQATIDWEPVRALVASDSSKTTLLKKLEHLFRRLGLSFDASVVALESLDIRLGRHHFASGNNSVAQSLAGFLQFLRDADDETIAEKMRAQDPERSLANAAPVVPSFNDASRTAADERRSGPAMPAVEDGRQRVAPKRRFSFPTFAFARRRDGQR